MSARKTQSTKRKAPLSSKGREKLAKVAARATASDSRTPTRLGRVPIIDVAFELRFEPSSPSASDLILGMIFKDLGTDLPNVATLPQASFPIEVIQSVPQLQYQPQRLMTGEQFQVALGPKVLAVLCKRPYPGWNLFKPFVLRVLKSLSATAIIDPYAPTAVSSRELKGSVLLMLLTGVAGSNLYSERMTHVIPLVSDTSYSPLRLHVRSSSQGGLPTSARTGNQSMREALSEVASMLSASEIDLDADARKLLYRNRRAMYVSD